MNTDRPGSEVTKEHREVILYLIESQGWVYKLPTGGGHPKLYPPDKTQGMIVVPMTGHKRGRTYTNWLAIIRRKGGHLPSGGKK